VVLDSSDFAQIILTAEVEASGSIAVRINYILIQQVLRDLG
jgi:hypothetical protein